MVVRKRWIGAAAVLLTLVGALLLWGRGSSPVTPGEFRRDTLLIRIDSWDTWTDRPPALPPTWVAQIEEMFGRRPRRADMVQLAPAPEGARRVMVRVFLAGGPLKGEALGMRLVTGDPAYAYRTASPLSWASFGDEASMQGIFDLYGPYKVLRLEVYTGKEWVAFGVHE